MKLVTTEHGIAADDLVYHGSKIKARLKALLHTVRLKRADAIIAVSLATRDAMIAKWHPLKPVIVIPNGVDVDTVRDSVDSLRTGPSAEGPRVLSLSRLSAEKRIPDLLRAFAWVRDEHADARLTVAGDGPLRTELEDLAARLGIGSAVDFPGFMDASEAMANADVLVQLSVWENCSYTLLDAVSAGLGVVATPVGGNPEIVGDANLVDADCHQEIASAVVKQWQEPATRPEFPQQWPSTSKMARATAVVYAGTMD
ncbi:glycosyltransferase involved in cell wall biosynthesis [Arthrobacter sp. UYEF6]